MAIELRVPAVGESITEVEIGEWLTAVGARVERDEPMVMIETDKVTVELPAPAAGTLTKVLKNKGESATVGEVIGYLEEGAAATAPAPAKPAKKAARPAAVAVKTPVAEPIVMPAAQRVIAERGIPAEQVKGSGRGGRVLKEDVVRATYGPGEQVSKPEAEEPAVQEIVPAAAPAQARPSQPAGDRQEEIVPMTPLRRRIAERLVQAQHSAALLTTFNEIEMTAVTALRHHHQEEFKTRYGIKLGLMSFFVKASIEALKAFPQLNAEIRDTNIVYRNYFDIGVAVSSERGLVVPVLRNAERMSLAEIEKVIADFVVRANGAKLKLDELQGGTFTISNGGVFGSLLSTPIVNPPQSGVLGLHAMEDRPVARDGQVVIRSMMYVALTYDHRIVDGREAVSFLRRIKECIEEPARMLVEI